jgi:hypothetical protein
VRVVDGVALAQRIEAVALAGMHVARERQRVEHRAGFAQAASRKAGGA